MFDMKVMRKAMYKLVIKMLRDCSIRTLGLSQETYANKILEQFYHKQ